MPTSSLKDLVRKALALAALLLGTSAFAEDGLVVHFTITKSTGTETSTYTDGVLMRLTEASTLKFPGAYEMRIESRAVGDAKVNLVVTLKDLYDGQPRYAGSAATTLDVGASQTIALHQLRDADATYTVFLDTAYGKVPASVR